MINTIRDETDADTVPDSLECNNDSGITGGKNDVNEPYVIRVDINSGMKGDMGQAEIAVKSDLTVSMVFLRQDYLKVRQRS